MWKQLAVLIYMTLATQVASFEFESIDGGKIDLSEFQGKPVLIVNTASRCGFTGQLEGMQKLHETYGPKGLVVLAVPSNDFRQELKSGEDVKEFCEVTYGLTLPMTDITFCQRETRHIHFTNGCNVNTGSNHGGTFTRYCWTQMGIMSTATIL